MLEKLGIKKLFIIAVSFVLIIILILVGALLYNKMLYSKTHSEVEVIMENAAERYFDRYEEKLPKEINNQTTVSAKTLVKTGLMKDLEDYLKDSSCTGEVTATKIDDKNYRYSTILDCGEDYKTITLNEYINENVEITTTGEGLYELNNELVYRGEIVNNYLKLNGNIYRIVKFVDGHPVVILTEITENTSWDTQYNVTTGANTGINDYNTSSIKNYLNNMYKGNDEGSLLSEKTRLLVTSYNVSIGKRCNDDTNKTGELENAMTFNDQYIGLLPLNDYLNASLDTNCTNSNSPSCANQNYLSKYKYPWWTATANSKNTFKAYLVDKTATSTEVHEKGYVRPVLHLVSDAIYVSGDGTKENPFKIK